jgi:DNA-binding transcriptional LysR family regulator
MLDAHQLNVFLTAAQTLNFTVAAKQLHMSQPSVSQHIRELENYFDTPLFIREGRRIFLSDAGRALIPMAQQLVKASVRIEETMHSLRTEVYGHLMVGCSATSGKYILPFLLAEFLKRHPKVEATCHVSSRAISLQMLCDGQVHLAVASANDFCQEVEFQKLISDPVVLITPLGHPWAARGEIEPDQLLGERFIMREEGSGTKTVAAQGLQRLGLSIENLPRVLTLGNSEAIALGVQEGIGVAFITQSVVDYLVSGRVAMVKVRGLEMQQDIYIGRHMHYPATAAQTAFWEYIQENREQRSVEFFNQLDAASYRQPVPISVEGGYL